MIKTHPHGRSVALFGMHPSGYALAAGAARDGVRLFRDVNELGGAAKQAGNGVDRGYKSIMLVACPGDDLAGVPAIYKLAVELRLLVTAIVITGPGAGNVEGGDANPVLQQGSDIIIITPDATCLDHMLDAAVG
jgi:hypothetical protein